ncbi:flagellar type III secretion system pore protein FliP [Pseudoalteromonas sp. MMG022]|uniref:flagellar type III secretion system pore protein FliP n=1 Tax=Pseudoalteromonas sp. MMG022 TaxID=2909978 RepID=UPI001EEDC622|nr:flagellar type III secretion system pore protein FliP [Pseudoalteromonas sp. MMG022]MCF6437000.1 flagellar type III secretion system pore protein FliP [Pseudoalteromonas sp. MMG022]
MNKFVLFVLLLSCLPSAFGAQQIEQTSLLTEVANSGLVDGLTPEVKTVFTLTMLSFIPVLLIAMTAFTRIVIVLSMLRHALGLQQTPPNIIIITLSLFLTFYTMLPVWEKVENDAVRPYLSNAITLETALDKGGEYMKDFMVSQTREEDFAAILKMANKTPPQSVDQVSFSYLVPAFLLSELTTAFKIAFVIFIPFLLIDLVVASVLMSLGMIMLPPISIALPIKVMLFVLIDGWSLVSQSLVSSFS